MAPGNGQQYAPRIEVRTAYERLREPIRKAVGVVADRLGAFAAGVPPVQGAGRFPSPFRLPQDLEQQKIVDSMAALGGRTTYFAGPVPAWISTYAGGLTARGIKGIHNEVQVSGWMVNKASLDEEIMLVDAHLRSVDDSCRDEITGRQFAIEACDDSDEAGYIADYQNAVADRCIVGYQKSCRRLLYANASGYAVEEAVYDTEPTPFRCKVGKQDIEVWGYHPRYRQWVSNKHTRWDVGPDECEIDMGGGRFVKMRPRKFIMHDAGGDFQIRRQGYLYPGSWLHLFKTNAEARWAVVLEIWGIPVPHGKLEQQLWQDQKRKDESIEMLRSAGRGEPFLTTDDFTIEKAFELTTGDARGMHAAFIGWCNTEQSKLVQGETLTTELGGVGSYNASETHADTKEGRLIMRARNLAETERGWWREVLRLACYEFDAAGNQLGENPRGLSARLKIAPEDVLQKVGIPYWRVQREMTPMARMEMYDRAVNSLRMEVDSAQAYREFGLQRPRKKGAALRGKGEILAQDERIASVHDETGGGEKSGTSKAPMVELTPGDLGTIVKVNEARESRGLPPIDGGDITVAENRVKLIGQPMPGGGMQPAADGTSKE